MIVLSPIHSRPIHALLGAGFAAALCAIAFAAGPAGAVITYTDLVAGLPGVSLGNVVWGDYDTDGDLDLVLTGSGGKGYVSRVYRNDAGTFNDVAAGLPGTFGGGAAWGDFDRDGDLDLALMGDSDAGFIARVYRNDAGTFTGLAAGLPGTALGSVAWGDVDNDGDLDLAVTGLSGSGFARVYRNDAGTFADLAAGLPGVFQSTLAWGDYDRDGDLDLALAGFTGTGYLSRVYRNDAGTFNDLVAGLPGVSDGSVSWGDYDHDGDLDLALTGDTGAGSIARVYRNDAGTFVDLAAGLPGVFQSSVAWGDHDNDGDLDLALTGFADSGPIALVYRNEAGTFIDVAAGLPGVIGSSVAWGDYDNDGDLDLALSGNSGEYIARLYVSAGAPLNSVPTPPSDLTAVTLGNQVTLSWSAASDAQTSQNGLSYNFRVGTTPDGTQISVAMASYTNGYRRVTALGNAQQRTSWTLNLPGAGTYYWSVQAIDAAWAGGPFAAERSFGGNVDVSSRDLPTARHSITGIVPNPTASGMRIGFAIGSEAPVRLCLVDLQGREVQVLVERVYAPGPHEIAWNGSQSGNHPSPGVYFARLEVAGTVTARRFVILR